MKSLALVLACAPLLIQAAPFPKPNALASYGLGSPMISDVQAPRLKKRECRPKLDKGADIGKGAGTVGGIAATQASGASANPDQTAQNTQGDGQAGAEIPDIVAVNDGASNPNENAVQNTAGHTEGTSNPSGATTPNTVAQNDSPGSKSASDANQGGLVNVGGFVKEVADTNAKTDAANAENTITMAAPEPGQGGAIVPGAQNGGQANIQGVGTDPVAQNSNPNNSPGGAGFNNNPGSQGSSQGNINFEGFGSGAGDGLGGGDTAVTSNGNTANAILGKLTINGQVMDMPSAQLPDPRFCGEKGMEQLCPGKKM